MLAYKHCEEASEGQMEKMRYINEEFVGRRAESQEEEELVKAYKEAYGKSLQKTAECFGFTLQSKYLSSQDIGYSETQVNSLSAAFNSPFDNSLNLLSQYTDAIKSIAERWDPAEYLAPYTAIVQSSGFGKSRLVCEYGRQKGFTFYICLRDVRSTGFPLASYVSGLISPSMAIASTKVEKNVAIVVYYICFFASCLQELFEWITSNQLQEFTQKQFSDFLERQLVIDHNARMVGVEFWKPIISRWKSMTQSCLFGFDLSKNPQSTSAGEFAIGRARYFMDQAIESLGKSKTPIHPIVFAFDEANALIDQPFTDNPYLHYLRSAMHHFPTLVAGKITPQIVCTLLDTFGKIIRNYLPYEIPDPSLRYITGRKLFEPFLTFGFPLPDTNNKLIDPDKDKIVALIEYGRFLWRSIDSQTLLKVACIKLLGTKPELLFRNQQNASDEHLMALLGCRLGIFLQANQDLAFNLVRSHCAMLMFSDNANKVLFTTYPSEPVLSEASAHLSGKYPNLLSWEKQMCCLLDKVRTGMIDAGTRGELVARCMLLMARDRSQPMENVVPQESPSRPLIMGGESSTNSVIGIKRKIVSTDASKELLITDDSTNSSANDSKPAPTEIINTSTTTTNRFLPVVSMINFINTLGGSKLVAAMDMSSGSRKRDYWNNSTVNFNHFVYVTFTPRVARAKFYYSRQAAIFCRRNEEIIDLMIPYRHRPDNYYSFLLIQVKNYDRVSSSTGISNLKTREFMLQEFENTFGFPNDKPILFLFMQVGYNQIARISKLKQSTGGKLYAAVITGISRKIYPFIASEEENNLLTQLAMAWADPRALHRTSKEARDKALLALYSVNLPSYAKEEIMEDLKNFPSVDEFSKALQ